MMKTLNNMDKASAPSLVATSEINVHFYDIDSVNILWHGNYVKYLENGREAFGRQYGLEYQHIYDSGYIAPIADLHIRYLHTVTYGERLIVETEYVPCRAAKLMFKYRIIKAADLSVAVEADTIQLFMTREGVFETAVPEFYRQWRKRYGYE